MGNRKKWIFNTGFAIVVFALTFYGVFHGENPKILLMLFDLANSWYWLGAVAAVFVFICCESCIIRILLDCTGTEAKRGHCLYYSFLGFFFSCITPSAGGGQPAQIYFMNKDGIDIGVSTPVLVIVTIFYKLVLILYGLLVLVFRPASIMNAPEAVRWWCLIGWLLNVLVIVAFVLVIVMPEKADRLLRAVLNLFSGRMKPEKIEKLHASAERIMQNYKEATALFRKQTYTLLAVLLISIFQRTVMFSVTWMVIRSFGLLGGSLPGIIAMQAMVSLGTDLLPLPGGSGANEALFLMLFNGICGEALDVPVLLASRGISYYGQIIMCGIVTLFAVSRIGKRKNNGRLL